VGKARQENPVINLLEETRNTLAVTNHTPDDIVFIGSETSGHQCTWGEFAVLADISYDPGYGSAKVATDLVIVFSDGSKLYRSEYDGSEWWKFSRPFAFPLRRLPIQTLVTSDIGWESLEEMAATQPSPRA